MAIDLAAALAECYPLLNASSEATMIWWDNAHLVQAMDDLAQELGRGNRLIASARRNNAFTGNQATYSWPTRHVATLQVSTQDLVLSEANIGEMEALSRDWHTETGDNPTHWVGNWQGLQVVRFYPTPTANGGEYSVICIEHPAAVTTGNMTVDFPSVLGELFVLAAVKAALESESRGARRETAALIEKMMAPIEDLITAYWGE